MERPNYDCFQHQVKGWRTSQATDIEKDQISAIQQGVVCFKAKSSEWKPMTGPTTTRKSMTWQNENMCQCSEGSNKKIPLRT